jgi:hypothetical protein
VSETTGADTRSRARGTVAERRSAQRSETLGLRLRRDTRILHRCVTDGKGAAGTGRVQVRARDRGPALQQDACSYSLISVHRDTALALFRFTHHSICLARSTFHKP